jgi:phage shock protein A
MEPTLNSLSPGFWLDAVQSVVLVALAFVQWLRKPGEDAGKAIKAHAQAVDEQLNGLRGRLQHVEDRLQHMPTDDELATLRGDVQRVETQVEGLGQLLTRMEHQQTLILQQILNRP